MLIIAGVVLGAGNWRIFRKVHTWLLFQHYGFPCTQVRDFNTTNVFTCVDVEFVNILVPTGSRWRWIDLSKAVQSRRRIEFLQTLLHYIHLLFENNVPWLWRFSLANLICGR